MSHSFTQLYVHAVFAVKNRSALIPVDKLQGIHAYIAKLLFNLGHSPLAVGGIGDHVHAFFMLNPQVDIASTMSKIKANSSRVINESRGNYTSRFCWQHGYSAFTCSKEHAQRVKNYVLHQNEHHRGMTFEEEMAEFAKRLGVEGTPEIPVPDF